VFISFFFSKQRPCIKLFLIASFSSVSRGMPSRCYCRRTQLWICHGNSRGVVVR